MKTLLFVFFSFLFTNLLVAQSIENIVAKQEGKFCQKTTSNKPKKSYFCKKIDKK